MWGLIVIPLVIVFVVGICVLMSAGCARNSVIATLRLFAGGFLICGAGYGAILLISKLT